jgi:hypothetical protein
MKVTDCTDNRRRDPRHRKLSAVKIHVGFGSNYELVSVYDCLVLDQSDSGLRIEFDGAYQFPERFVVEFPAGRRVWGRVAWCSGLEAGIEIIPLGEAPSDE